MSCKIPNEIEMVEIFHNAYGCPVYAYPVLPPTERVLLREKLMREELNELCAAMQLGDKVGIVDGLCDLLYVIYGTALEHGMGGLLKEAFSEVHRSNMSKLDQDCKPIYREDGKVLKGPYFTPPNLLNIIKKYTPSY
jgi:predicted HAD superfamily Cof-like phosphohydrolase